MKELTFQQLLDKKSKTQVESMLCQSIAALSTQPQFTSMTPWEVFDHIKKTSQQWSNR